jgi:hypothetical protein
MCNEKGDAAVVLTVIPRKGVGINAGEVRSAAYCCHVGRLGQSRRQGRRKQKGWKNIVKSNESHFLNSFFSDGGGGFVQYGPGEANLRCATLDRRVSGIHGRWLREQYSGPATLAIQYSMTAPGHPDVAWDVLLLRHPATPLPNRLQVLYNGPHSR